MMSTAAARSSAGPRRVPDCCWDDPLTSDLCATMLLRCHSNLVGADRRITNCGGGTISAKYAERVPLGSQIVVGPVIELPRPGSSTSVHRTTRARGRFNLKILSAAVLLASGLANGAATPTQGPAPIIDNERVTVWDMSSSLGPAEHDFVTISLSSKGSATFNQKGATAGRAGLRSVIIELKDNHVPPIANNSGYPNAFPRPHAKRLLENDRVIVWSYRWYPGLPTPMHLHDKDVVVVYEEPTALKSTAADGSSVVNEYQSGDVRFNNHGRVHTEQLIRGTGSAIITELK
jgi:hypothetical protein